MLVFPEVCEKEELEDLEAMVEPIERFFDNCKWFLLQYSYAGTSNTFFVIRYIHFLVKTEQNNYDLVL